MLKCKKCGVEVHVVWTLREDQLDLREEPEGPALYIGKENLIADSVYVDISCGALGHYIEEVAE